MVLDGTRWHCAALGSVSAKLAEVTPGRVWSNRLPKLLALRLRAAKTYAGGGLGTSVGSGADEGIRSASPPASPSTAVGDADGSVVLSSAVVPQPISATATTNATPNRITLRMESPSHVCRHMIIMLPTCADGPSGVPFRTPAARVQDRPLNLPFIDILGKKAFLDLGQGTLLRFPAMCLQPFTKGVQHETENHRD